MKCKDKGGIKSKKEKKEIMVTNEGNSIDGNGLCEVRDSNERWKGLLPQ